jgi:hypothetical protein
MPSISSCLTIAGRMSDADATDLLDRVDQYIASGIAPAEAQSTAVQDILAELQAERDEVVSLVPAEAANDAVEPVAETAAETPAMSQAAEPEPQAGPGFYSALRRDIAAAKTNASPAEYWLNAIKGAINKGTVKADEVQWSGVRDFISQQDGKIKKADLLAWLDSNGVKVEETVLGAGGNKGVGYYSEDERWGGEPAEFGSREDAVRAAMSAFDMSREEAEAFVSDTDETYAAPATDTSADTKYGQYVLPGGQNYREVLLTLPPDPAADRLRVVKKRLGMSREEGVTDDEFRSLTEEEKRLASTPRTEYRSGHWDAANVVVHVRLNDRTDSEGRKVLFVEEVQGDWPQAIRKQEQAIKKAVDDDFIGITKRMEEAGVLEVNCD